MENAQHPWQNRIDLPGCLVRWCPACGAIAVGDPEFEGAGDVELPAIAIEVEYHTGRKEAVAISV